MLFTCIFHSYPNNICRSCFVYILCRRYRCGISLLYNKYKYLVKFCLFCISHDCIDMNPIRLSWVVSDLRHFFSSHYSKSVYPKNTYPHPKKTLGLEDPLCWMAFPQWQPGLSSEQVKFALGLKRPTITLTSVQTCFERQGKILNFYEAYKYFWEIFLFSSHIHFSFKNDFFYECSWSLWVLLKDFSFFWVIYWFFISYSMAQRTSTKVLKIPCSRTERVNYLDYLDCLKVMNCLINFCIFSLSKKR